MTKADKLLQKIKSGKFDARDGRQALKDAGWSLDRQKGSHETWARGDETLTLAAKGDDLKPYQIKDIKKAVLGE